MITLMQLTAKRAQLDYEMARRLYRTDPGYEIEVKVYAQEKWDRFRTGTFEFPVEMFTNNPPCRMLGLK